MTNFFFITIPKGFEEALQRDLAPLGLKLNPERGGFRLIGSLADAYRVCLHSRVANRVLLPLKSFAAPTPEKLYGGVKSIRWSDHLTPRETIAVDFVSSRSQISHTQFGAQKTKDAICDQFTSVAGERPSVNLVAPDLRINVHLNDDQATVSLDLSGASLHQRGYRDENVPAPLKENLAAAILLLLGWDELSASGECALFDPMCGSGTFLTEAAMIAARMAPGRLRERFGFHGWKQHDEKLWQKLAAEARAAEKRIDGIRFYGFDADSRALRAAEENFSRFEAAARTGARPEFARREFPQSAESRESWGEKGLFVANPPYGERLGDVEALKPLYEAIGDALKKRFPGWRAGILTGSPDLMKAVGLKPSRKYPLFNGPIECRLLSYELYAGSRRNPTAT